MGTANSNLAIDRSINFLRASLTLLLILMCLQYHMSCTKLMVAQGNCCYGCYSATWRAAPVRPRCALSLCWTRRNVSPPCAAAVAHQAVVGHRTGNLRKPICVQIQAGTCRHIRKNSWLSRVYCRYTHAESCNIWMWVSLPISPP